MRIVRTAVISIVAAAVIFVGYGSWRTSDALRGLLTVGAITAQGGDGWPAPETAFDIGFVGDPKIALGIDFEDVTLQGELGAMPAWLVRPTADTSKVWGIVVHGIGGRRENGYRFVPSFLDAGMPALLVTYRNDEGAPRSTEGVYAFGLTEWRDVETAVEYCLGRGATSVALLGESMGGGIVGQFLRHSPLAPKVSALLLDAPAVDFPAVLADQMRRAGAPLPAILGPTGMLLFQWRSGVPISRAVVMDDIAGFAGPLFISHGSGARVVPVATSDRLVEQRRGPTEYLRTDADHIQSFKSDPARYRDALTAFLRGVASSE